MMATGFKTSRIKVMIWRCDSMKFSVDEEKIIKMYNAKSRVQLIIQLKQATEHIEEKELAETVSDLISKLAGMTDDEYNSIEFSTDEDSEVTENG